MLTPDPRSTLAAAACPQPPAVDPRRPTRLEAKHLRNIRQVTSGFAKAGEGYFRPDGKAIIFQAAQPGEDDYQIYTLDLAPDAKPEAGQHRQGEVHLRVLPPRRQVDPLRLDPPRPGPRDGRGRREAEGPGLQPDRALPLGLRPGAWTSSRPTPTARTSSA